MPFITRTALIYTIGIQYVGLNSLLTSVLSVLSFAELGIGSALVYAMYEPIAKKNVGKVCSLLAFYRKCYRVIGVVILVAGLMALPFLDCFISSGVPTDINIRVLFLVYLANTVISYFTFAYRQSLFTASQRVDIPSKISAILSLLSGLLQVLILVFLKNYYLYAAVLPVITLANNLAVGFLSARAFPQYVCKGRLEKAELKLIGKNVLGLVFGKVGSVVLAASDTLVISAFLGLWILGVYNGYAVIVTAAAGLIQVVQTSLIPTIGNKIALDSKESCYRSFRILNFMYMWLSTVMFVCLVGLLQPFVAIWQGSENTLAIGVSLMLSLSFLVQRSGEMSWMYREAAGLWWQGRFLPFFSSILNLMLNLISVHFIGIYGVVLSTIVALLVINLPMGAWVLFRHYFQSASRCFRYVAETIGYLLLACLIGVASLLACNALPLEGVPDLAVRLLVCLVLSNAVLIVAFSRSGLFRSALCMIGEVVPARIKNLAIFNKLLERK